jgi:hypothetical protein
VGLRVRAWRILGALLLALGLNAALAGAARAERPAYPGVADPIAFMRDRYAQYERGGAVPALALDGYASTNLRLRLYAFDAAAGGEELDSLDPWVDGVDWRIGPVALARLPGHRPGRQIIAARFRNHGWPVLLRFFWVRERGAWYLDEIVRPGRGAWTLTGRLAARPRHR